MAETLKLADADATRALGRSLVEHAGDGLVIALVGELGAGKTTFAQGVGDALGCRGPIISPTFQLLFVHEDGRLPLYHADPYRLGDESELVELGFDELLGQRGVALVEWADRFPELLPQRHIEVQLAYDGLQRVARVIHHGAR